METIVRGVEAGERGVTEFGSKIALDETLRYGYTPRDMDPMQKATCLCRLSWGYR